MNPLIILEHISAAYDGKPVLHDVCLTVGERDFLGVIGPNGGGKTTLLKLLMGLKSPVSGAVRYYRNGQSVSSIRMGYLPQYSGIDRKFPISVREVVESGLIGEVGAFGRYTPVQHEQVVHTIQRVGLEGLEHYSLSQLSGGQLQRTLLGRALVSSPDVIVLDEPSTFLDHRSESELYTLLEEVNKQCAIILVGHDIATVVRHSHSIACVNGHFHYLSSTESVTPEWIGTHFGSLIDL